MFQGKLPNGLFPRDVVLWLDGLDGGYADRKTKTAYTATNMTKGVEINGGTELIFNGTSSVIGCGSIGNVNSISMWVKPTTTTGYLIDLDGTSTITIVGGVLTTTSFISPTIYVNGVSGSTTMLNNQWNSVVVTTETSINATACNIGKIGSNFFSGSITNILLLNKSINANQANQLFNKIKQTYNSDILKTYGNLTFFKDYSSSQSTANADFSIGSSTATVTSARSASNPATYVDSSGTIQTITTANVPRFTSGFYNDTGFVSRPGVLVEQAGTNLLVQSADFSDVAWTSSSITVTTNTLTAPDGTLTADTLTATGANGTILQAQTITSAVKTFSIFLQRKTGTGSIYLTLDGGSTYTEVFLSAIKWKRFFITQTLANPSVGIKIATSGDAVYAWGAQNEAWNFPTSYIPTVATAVTRVKETIKYPISSNRTAATETGFISITPFWDGVDVSSITGNMRFLDTDTKSRLLIVNTVDFPVFLPNNTDNSGTTMSGTTKPLKFNPYTIAFNCVTGASFYYLNGTQESTSSSAFTTNAWGTSFYVGSDNASALQICGIVHSVAFYSENLSNDKITSISTLLKPSTIYNTYYIDSTSGVDTNDGLTTSEPWSTVAKVNSRTLIPGETVCFKKGSTWREQITVGQNGTSSLPITYTNYGTGELPKITGGDLVSSWTDLGSNKWSATFTSSTTPLTLLFNTNVKGVRKGSVGALTVEYDFYWTANTLTIYSPSNPGTRYSSIEAAIRDNGILISNKSYIFVDGIKFENTQVNGITINTHGVGSKILNCTAQYNTYDGINVHDDVSGILIKGNTCQYNGVGREIGGGQGDGISVHDTVEAIVESNIIISNDKAGIDHVGSSRTINRYNFMYDNDLNLTFGGTGADATTQGYMECYYNVIVLSNRDSYGIYLNGTSSNNPKMSNYNNTIYGNGVGSGISLDNTGTMFASNNTITNCSKGIEINAGTFNGNYNNVYGNTTNYVGALRQSNDVSTNPLFSNPGGNNFNLKQDSLLINAGTQWVSGPVRDYLGTTVSQVSNIGAYEKQV